MIGNVSSREAWDALGRDGDAALVDVRTVAEWSYVGLPDLAPLGKRVVLAAWQEFPSGEVNPDFVSELRAAGLGPDADLYFICRSGARSLAAAQAASAAGFRRVTNIADGFEGPRDETHHRGTLSGWKAAGLPWHQS